MAQKEMDVDVDTDVEMLCSTMEQLTIEEKRNDANELFKFLFQWHPNLSVNHTEHMTQVWFNAAYYSSFQQAIKQFNMQNMKYHVTYNLRHNSDSYYDCCIDIYYDKRHV